MRKRLSLAVLGAASVVALALGSALPAQAAALPVTYNWITGFVGNLPNAAKAPSGAITTDAKGNLASCSSPGKLPVILVHGTWENQNSNWASLSPLLRNAGFCVYTLNYGGNPGDALNGHHAIASNAAEFGVFVDKVRGATGSNQVDVIGHSQGGMMPRYYIKFGTSWTGGAFGAGVSKIHKLIGLSPSNHGTTLSGLQSLGQALGIIPGLAVIQPAAIDQSLGSPFMAKLATCPGGRPSADICAGDTVQYVVLETKNDEVVTPYTQAFLAPNPAAPAATVINFTLQQGCGLDQSEHLATAFDSYADGLVLKAMGISNPASVPGASPSCKFISPLVGG